MLITIAEIGTPPLLVGLGIAYAVGGAATAAWLGRAGAPPSVRAAALLAWPLLLTSRTPNTRDTHTAGPRAERIDAAVDALERTLADPLAGEVGARDDTRALREALHASDRRLVLVDALLADPSAADPAVAERVGALRDARSRTIGEIDAVLSDLTDLRMQVGLVTLAGNAMPVRERLRELRLRVGTLEEVTRAARCSG